MIFDRILENEIKRFIVYFTDYLVTHGISSEFDSNLYFLCLNTKSLIDIIEQLPLISPEIGQSSPKIGLIHKEKKQKKVYLRKN